MAKMKDTIEDKIMQENIELDARYQREVANDKELDYSAIPYIAKSIFENK